MWAPTDRNNGFNSPQLLRGGRDTGIGSVPGRGERLAKNTIFSRKTASSLIENDEIPRTMRTF